MICWIVRKRRTVKPSLLRWIFPARARGTRSRHALRRMIVSRIFLAALSLIAGRNPIKGFLPEDLLGRGGGGELIVEDLQVRAGHGEFHSL